MAHVSAFHRQWMSPEQQERSEDELSTGYLNEKIDVYALGKSSKHITVCLSLNPNLMYLHH